MLSSTRQQTLDHAAFVRRQADSGRRISSFFEIPGASTKIVKIDFSHCCDLGTTADFLHNFLWHLTMNKMAGGTHTKRCQDLFKDHIQPFYRLHDVDSRLPCLRPTMLKKTGGSYKLRCKAGEARRLVQLVPALCHRFLDQGNEVDAAIWRAGLELQAVYTCLSADAWRLP